MVNTPPTDPNTNDDEIDEKLDEISLTLVN